MGYLMSRALPRRCTSSARKAPDIARDLAQNSVIQRWADCTIFCRLYRIVLTRAIKLISGGVIRAALAGRWGICCRVVSSLSRGEREEEERIGRRKAAVAGFGRLLWACCSVRGLNSISCSIVAAA